MYKDSSKSLVKGQYSNCSFLCILPNNSLFKGDHQNDRCSHSVTQWSKRDHIPLLTSLEWRHFFDLLTWWHIYDKVHWIPHNGHHPYQSIYQTCYTQCPCTMSFRSPKFESSIKWSCCYVFLIWWYVHSHYLAIMPCQCHYWCPAWMCPYLNKKNIYK